MYRTLLPVTFLSLICLAGCGGQKDGENGSPNSAGDKTSKSEDNSTSKTGDSPAGASSLAADQQAQLALKIDIASAMKTFSALDSLKEQAGVNIPETATSLELFAGLPAQFTPDPSGINFHVKLGFSDEADAKKSYDE
ncbi:MAG: hypothetical protein VX438_17825, partial [Planctomycetota bacterium]|nr:hypothetical protein [Planctomycetota bacterium]